ncbi:MAG: DUF3073 family protein [Streptosporangiales bacterium]|nr:DUF3073 family protein [Streptosporangiales bacterium]
MGRGRAKAKQTKVARKLKYQTGGTDLSQLAEELGASSPTIDGTDDVGQRADDTARDDDDLVARYSDYADNPNPSAR